MLTKFCKIEVNVEYEHVEEWGSRKLSGPQLANRKTKIRFFEAWNLCIA